MKKKALLLSDEIFLDYNHENGRISQKDNKILKKLKRKFEFDNISSKEITSLKASNYIKEFIKHYNYSHCIISLKNFDDSLKEAIAELINNGIKIIVIAAPKASKEEIEKMESLSDSSSVKYIVYDDVVKEQSATKVNSIIVNLCA